MENTILKMAKVHLAKASGEQQFIDLVQGTSGDYSTVFHIVKAFKGSPGATEEGFFSLLEAVKRNCPDYVSPDGALRCFVEPGFADWMNNLEDLLKVLWDSSSNQKYREALCDLYRFTFEKYMLLKDEKCKFIDLLLSVYYSHWALGDLDSFGLTDDVMKELEEKSGSGDVLFIVDLFRQVKNGKIKFANDDALNQWRRQWKESYISKYPFRKQPW
jgi:hypothetical protein